MNRRRFVKTVAASVGGTALLSERAWARGSWRFFTPAEAELADAIAEQIIPADEDPGAHDAGVVGFMDRQLSGFYKRHQQEYRAGLAGVDETSRALHGKSFLDLEWDQQTAVLRALEANKAPGETWKKQSAAGFFNLVRNHTMQGFYGSPRHGGNRGWASYRMLGLDHPPVIGQNRYRQP